MAQHKFWTRRRAMLSFERQPFPAPCHVDQDVAHSQAWRALGHLTTFDRVLSALQRRNHLTVPRIFAPSQYCHGQQNVVSIVSRPGCTSAPIVTFAPQHTCALCGSALLVAAIAGWIRCDFEARSTLLASKKAAASAANECDPTAMLADGRAVIGHEDWRAHQVLRRPRNQGEQFRTCACNSLSATRSVCDRPAVVCHHSG